MTNYEAILKLSPERMESFLDQVYIAGLNTGGYAARLDEEQEAELLGINPFDMAWLNELAEPALTAPEDEHVLTGLTGAISQILEDQQPEGEETEIDMSQRHDLWEVLYRQKKLFEEQEGRVFQACKALAAAVLAGQITDSAKIKELLTELLAIEYQHIAAWELHHQVRNFAKEKFPDEWSVPDCGNDKQNDDELKGRNCL